MIAAAGASALVLAGGAAVAAPLSMQLAGRRALARRCREQGAVVLSYDDGPEPGMTPRVLDVLGELGARATFFALGRRGSVREALMDRVVAEGHEVGCHTYDHLNAWRVSPRKAARDLDRGFDALAPWTGAARSFRPPHGKVSAGTLAGLARRRARLCLWTHDSGDTAATLPDPGAVVRSVLDAGGGVVLMHDFDRVPFEPERQEFVLELTRGLVDGARGRGLSLMTCGELL